MMYPKNLMKNSTKMRESPSGLVPSGPIQNSQLTGNVMSSFVFMCIFLKERPFSLSYD